MHIVIVGAGAIGQLFGSLIARSGEHTVQFLEKQKEIVDALNSHGIHYTSTSGKDVSDMIKVTATTDGNSIQSCDLIILAVKSFTTSSAVHSIAQLASGGIPVVTIQTGLGNCETIAELVGTENVIGGVTYHGATALTEARIRHAGTGPTIIGEINGDASEKVAKTVVLFNGAGIEARASENIMGHIWSKSIVYSAINPITAILRLKNGQLLEKMETIALTKRLIDEGKLVAQAYAVQLPVDDLYDQLLEVCRKSAENLSPMLQDILFSRRTEIDALNGAIFTLGKQKNIQVPIHQTMTEMIRLLEKWRYDREF